MQDSTQMPTSATLPHAPPLVLTPADQAVLLPRYEILEEVGRGGMGVVYRARHRLLNRLVAIKVCMPDARLDRFTREAQLLASIQSPHIVPVHDFELRPDGRALLVMEWIDGTDIAKVMQTAGGPLSEATALPWMADVCGGMQAAADQGIVHRDLKPSNILVRQPTGRALVADFGLARSTHVEQLSLSGALMGTPHYMAPEQAEDPRGVDTRADIYSFGATFYHVLTGRPPFQGDTYFTILFKHKTEPVISPRACNPDLSGRVTECVERCLAKSPAERFGSFRAVAESLQRQGQAPSPWDLSDDPELESYQQQYRARRGLYLNGKPEELKQPDSYPFAQRRLLTIGFGDLVDQEVDALVSSDSEMLSMGGGVSAALHRAAGATLAHEAHRYVPVRAGRAVVTSAGALRARFVFHAVTIGSKDGQYVLPSRDLISEILESCFYHADTLNVKSIAFPLLGTGVAGLSPDVCLDTMFRFLSRKLLHGLTTVRLVRIILFHRRPAWR
jgi:serine/threonine protein kinase